MSDMHRSWSAFSQHYSLNASRWSNSDLNPWTHVYLFFGKDFPEATSIFDAIRINPSSFLKHIFSNFLRAIPLLLYLLVAPYPLLDPSSIVIRSVAFVLLIVNIKKNILHNPFDYYITKTIYDKKQIDNLIILVLFAMPIFISSIVIYPRPHYLILLLPIIIYFLSLIYIKIEKQPIRKYLIAFTILAFIITPISKQIDPNPRLNLTVIKLLRKIQSKSKEEIKIFSDKVGFSVYINNNYCDLSYASKIDDFDSYITKNDIDIIIDSEELRNHIKLKSDPTWHDFRHNPAAKHYKKLNISSKPPSLIVYIKKNI